MSFRHDSTGVNPDAGFPVADEGWYTLKIVSAEEKQSKGGNDMVQLDAKILNHAQFNEVEVRHWVVFLPADSPGAWNSVQFRKCIGVPFGGDDVVDANEWVGKRFMGYLIKEDYNGVTRNKIKKVSPMRGEGKIEGLEEPYEPGTEPDEEVVIAPPRPARPAAAVAPKPQATVNGKRKVPAAVSAGSDNDIPF